jgi:hypothetical protein
MKRKVIAIEILFLFLFISIGNISSPLLHSENSEPLTEIKLEGNTSHFYWNTNKSCCVVAVSSPHTIYFDDIIFKFTVEINGTKETSGASIHGFFLTNGTWFGFIRFGISEEKRTGDMRYFQFDLGPFNYTYENRKTKNISGSNPIGELHLRNRTLPPGKWYFVFTGAIFDIEQDITPNISVEMNFSNECKDLHISVNEGGKMYALWYGEFDASIIISKSSTFEMMLNGRYKFHIDNTFMYSFCNWPTSQGFWRIKWVKPDGNISVLNTIIINEHYYPDIGGECIKGIGRNGDYELITNYVDYKPLLSDKDIASPVYFFGVDVKLP